jgi:hypothetical protein
MLLTTFDNTLDALAIWRPSIKFNSTTSTLKINNSSIEIRVVLIAGGILAGLFYMPVFSLPYSLVGIGSTFIPKLYHAFEKVRAVIAINQIAIDQFMNNDEVPDYILEHIRENPSIVRQLMQTPGCDINKPSSQTEKPLIQYLREKINSSNCPKDVAAAIVMLEKYQTLTKEEKLSKFLNARGEETLYLLEKDLISPTALTDHEQCLCLKSQGGNKRVLELMIKKGFKVNAKDDNNETPLIIAIRNKKLKSVCFYLSQGATIPPLDTKIKVCFENEESDNEESDMEEKSITLENFLKDKPLIAKALDQASSRIISTPFIAEEINILKFWKPATHIEANHYAVDNFSISIRTLIVAQPIFISLFIASVSTSSLFLMGCGSLSAMPIVWLYNKMERSRATKALNELSIQTFKDTFPPLKILKHIAKNDISLIHRLDGDLTKIDMEGKSLWDWACTNSAYWIDSLDRKHSLPQRLETFEHLADAIFKNELATDLKFHYFIKALEGGEVEFAEYLLSTDKIKADDFTDGQQFECWLKLWDSRQFALLKSYGFKIDARNKMGLTPLEYLLKEKYSIYPFLGRLGFSEHVEALLKNKATLPENILTDEEHIKRLLDKYRNINV